MSELKREFEISAAYDKRPKYGQHCAEFRFYVKGPKGAVQFVLFTGWYPSLIPTPDKDWRELSTVLKLGKHDAPMPADLGYHSPVPRYEDQSLMDPCHVLPEGKCYYDGSSLNASRIFSIMVHQGGDAMWKALEDYYAEVFAAQPAPAIEAQAKPFEAQAKGKPDGES